MQKNDELDAVLKELEAAEKEFQSKLERFVNKDNKQDSEAKH